MKKILIGLVALLAILMGAGFMWYQSNYGGQAYYVQIKADGKEITDLTSDGEKMKRYEYQQIGYSDKGAAQSLTYTASHNLKQKAYLKITYNKSKGVTSWNEVQADKVPKLARDKIKAE